MQKLFLRIWLCSGFAFANEFTECRADSTGRTKCDQTALLQVDLNVKQDRAALQTEGKANLAAQQSLDLHHRLAMAAESLPDGTRKELFKQFRVCGQCRNFKRFGEKNDGGYLMCMDGLPKGSVSAAYSIGVEHHDKWSDDVGKFFGIAVNQFDCTINNSTCQGCRFFQKCIVGADSMTPMFKKEDGWSLWQALENTGQANAAEGALLMKMDIEGSEWPVFAANTTFLQKFSEIIVEFHWLNEEDRHALYLQALKNIAAAGFKIVHLHGNNNHHMYNWTTINNTNEYHVEMDKLSLPIVLEATFARSAARPGGCASDQVYRKLDAPNKPGVKELAMAHMNWP